MTYQRNHQFRNLMLGLTTSILLLSGVRQARAGYTTIDPPGSTYTRVTGISGNNIVGAYEENSSSGIWYGFLYNSSTSTYKTLTALGAFSSLPSLFISGNNIVVNNTLYNISTSTFTPISPPNAVFTTVVGISGNTIFGQYYNGNYSQSGSIPYPGFIYNISTSTYTMIAPTQAQIEAEATGVSGNSVVGWYYDANNATTHGFLYNTSTASYSDLNVPGSTSNEPIGISGNNIIGINLSSGYYFLYNTTASTFTTLNLEATAVSGNNVVGSAYLYNASSNRSADFVTWGSCLPVSFLESVYGRILLPWMSAA